MLDPPMALKQINTVYIKCLPLCKNFYKEKVLEK